jgi:hypothetical protein
MLTTLYIAGAIAVVIVVASILAALFCIGIVAGMAASDNAHSRQTDLLKNYSEFVFDQIEYFQDRGDWHSGKGSIIDDDDDEDDGDIRRRSR